MSKPPTAGLGSSTSKGPAESDDGRSTTPVAAAGQTATVQNPAAASAASSQAQSSSLLTSTSAGPESSSASSNTASGNTSTQTPHATQKSSNTGLIAGIAVLAVLLAIALAAIGFLILRKKRKSPKRGEYEPSYEQKTPLDPSSAVGLDNLESDVKSRDNKIRELQAALLKHGHGGSDIDDRQIRTRFTALSQNINDWVMTYFKGQTFTNPSSSRTLGLLRKVAPSYDGLLQDPRLKYLVIRAVVMENITEAFAASEFVANIQFSELKQGFSRYASPDKTSEWRALTVGLLQSTPDFSREKASSVQEVTTRIESVISELAGGLGAPHSQTKNLLMIVDTAADLSVELDKQQATASMAADFYPGRRLSYSGAPCTVRYTGEVHGTKGQWLGVEWDDPVRGKHDGSHGGVKYFDCQNPNPTAGSFIRPTRQKDESYGFLDALRKKYGSSTTEGLSCNVAIRISGKTVEEVGFEKINQQLASLHDLRIVVLDGLCIHGILSRRNQTYVQEREHASPESTVPRVSAFNCGERKDALRELEEQDLKIQELDLSRNLIEDFCDVKAIVNALKSLKALNLRQAIVISPSMIFANYGWLNIHKAVRELYLDEVFLTQKEIASLVNSSGLTTLSLASNNLSTPFARMTIGSLKSLNLASNRYASLAGLPDLSTNFPSLESLSLRSNPIASLTSSDVLLSVITLDLSSTLLPEFDSLLPIPIHFPRLTTLLTAHTPLHGLPASNLHTIARIKTLTSLNHSRISPQERTNAELYYLSAIASELSSIPEDKEAATLERHPRYAELCDTHGAPAIKRETPVSDEPKPGTLAARLTKFTFYLPPSGLSSPSLGSDSTLPPPHDTDPPVTEIQRELPRTVGIYKLKGLVGKMFGLRPMGLRLVWETDEWDPVPSLNDDDDNWGVSDEEEDAILPEGTPQGQRTFKDPSKWARREIELLDGTKSVGFWIEGREARVRVEWR